MLLIVSELAITARQYGEVVLPDASTGQSPGTPRQRGQKFITVKDLNCGQMRVSGCRFWQDLSWEQGAAKTMTNNLPILSVLWVVLCVLSYSRVRGIKSSLRE